MMKDVVIKNTKVFLAIGLLLILISPWLFTRSAMWSEFDFTQTGAIGDTIGGLTAPVINLIGAWLVFISFKSQIEANNLQRKALKAEEYEREYNKNFETLLRLLDDVKNDIMNLTYYGDGGKPYYGKMALNLLKNKIDTREGERFDSLFEKIIFGDLKYVIIYLEKVLSRVQRLPLLEKDRELLELMLKIQYDSLLKPYISSMIKSFESDKRKTLSEDQIEFYVTLKNFSELFEEFKAKQYGYGG